MGLSRRVNIFYHFPNTFSLVLIILVRKRAPRESFGHEINAHILILTPSSQWHTEQSNVDRTNAIIKQIASMFIGIDVVPIIAPLNE